jgi:polar amino acid transport system substrate-binding protein
MLFMQLSVFSKPVDSQEHIRVVTESWYPFNYMDDHGDIVGKSSDYVRRLLKEANLDYSIELFPWSRSMSLASSAPNVLIYTILRTSDREELFHWVCPITTKNTHKIYKLSSRHDIKINQQTDVKNYSIAVTRDTFLHAYMTQQGLTEGINLQLTADDSTNAKLFFAGRVDLLAEFDNSIAFKLQEQGLAQSTIEVVFAIPKDQYPDYCLGLSRQTSQLVVDKIRKAQQRLQSQ